MGFRAPPAMVGSMRHRTRPRRTTTRPDGTPAPLQVGDRILYFDDKYQHDFTKITLTVALAGAGQTPAVRPRASTAREEHLLVTPCHATAGRPHGFLMLGVGPAPELKGIASKR